MLVNKMSKQLQMFFHNPISCTQKKTFWELEKFTHTVFGRHLLHCHTVSYSKHCFVKHHLLESCSSFSNQFSKILHFSKRRNKQLPAKIFQKGPFLTVSTTPLDSQMTSQNASFGQHKKHYARCETENLQPTKTPK